MLKVLQKSYYGKVKMIYIDPPYNTGNDSFVYPDDFSETKAEYQEKGNINLNRLNLWQKNAKDSGKYHSSWLSMMYPRLFMARNLLREDGVIFISIDDNEQANLKLLMDEIFGEENFINIFVWQSRTSKQNDTDISVNHEYILAYSKNRKQTDKRLKQGNEKNWYKSEQFAYYPLPLNKDKFSNPDNDKRGNWKADPFDAPNVRHNLSYEIINPNTKEVYFPPKGRCWRTEKEKYLELLRDNRILFGKTGDSRPQLKVFYEEKKNYGEVDTTWWSGNERGTATEGTKESMGLFNGEKYFDFPKPVRVISNLLRLSTKNNSNDLILDFFAGSGTTAHAVMELNAEDGGNRQFICVQMPEPTDEKSEAYKAGYQTIADITRARIQKVCDKLNEAKRKSIEQEKAKNPVFATELNEQFEPFSFKNYHLQASNFKIWQSDIDTEEELLAQLELYAQPHTKAETPEENLLTELMLKAGFMLTANVQTITTDGIKLYDIENGTMTVALSALSEKVILTICERKPKEFICLDNLFESDVQKSNWSLQLAEAGVNLQVI